MAKLSRTELKGIVKECLVEILNEGMMATDHSSQMNLTESKSRSVNRDFSSTHSGMVKSPSKARQPTSPRRSALDSITYGIDQKKPVNENFDNNVNSAVNVLTSDPTMQSIFQDTARTTLQNQTQATMSESSRTSHEAAIMTQGDAAARKAAASDPMNMFSGASDKWAALAFSQTPSK
tara:strand:+ start:9333 stop:9866 length:534 start_codon:yes stop_codon:yes gene_type:complete